VVTAIEESAHQLSEMPLSFESCSKYLELPESLHHSSSFGPLIDSCCKFLAKEFENFEEMWESENFKTLCAVGVQAIFESSRLKVNSENTMFQALKKWLKVDKKNRKQHLLRLLPLIRFPLMDVNFLADVVKNDTTLSSTEGFQDLFAEAMLFQSYSEARREAETKDATHLRFVPRVGHKPKAEKILNWDINHISKIKCDMQRYSCPFWLNGYNFFLEFARTSDDQACVYAFLHREETGLPEKYFVKVNFEFWFKSYVNGQTRLDRVLNISSVFCRSHGWGDTLCPWSKIADPKFGFLHDDTLSTQAKISIVRP